MTKGGYQILDLSGIDFRIGISQYVRGAYEKLESTRKAILVSGLTVGDVEYRDMFLDFFVSNGNFVTKFGSEVIPNITITIGSSVDGNDPITITAT